GVAIGPGLGDDSLHRITGQTQHIDVSRAEPDEIGIPGGVEGDPGSVGRPREPADAVVLALGALLAGLGLLQRLGHVDGPEVLVVILLAYDLEIAEVLLAVLRLFFLRRCGGEGDALAVRRPLKAVDPGLDLRELHRLPAVGWDGVDLVLVAGAVAGKGQPGAVGRPGHVAGGLVPSGELILAAGGR